MQTRLNRRNGFTLIELMIVVSIVGVLAMTAYPAYRGYVRKGKRAEARAALMQAMQQQERFFSLHNHYQAYDGANAETGFKWHSGDNPATSAYRIRAAACAGDVVQNCIELSAIPVGAYDGNGGFQDDQCGTLTLNSKGERTAAGQTQAAPPQLCW